MTDNELLAALEGCTLPYAQWTHRAHVRVAYLLACRHDLARATGCMRSLIQAYNRARSTPETLERGYHETITQAFMRLVFAARLRTGPHLSSAEFCAAHPELLHKSVLQSYYSQACLMTKEAKTKSVEPDLCLLPTFLAASITTFNVMARDTMDVVRQLFEEYSRSLDVDLGFQDFEAELCTLPGKYSLPQGRLRLAYQGEQPAGCIALRLREGGVGELKRLWVRPQFRGLGIGRHLAELMILEARRMGYCALRLDTLRTMTEATRLYHSLGFVEIGPYTHNPSSDAVFMELRLDGGARQHTEK